MRAIKEIDVAAGTITVEAGVTMEAVQKAADAAELFFPLDLGGRGSCQIGGNISTNAGGNRVLRYGMARDLVLGVEAVLADGTVIDALRKVIKNNSGYDLRQLFIGAEGTLGIVTQIVLRLFPEAAQHLHRHLRREGLRRRAGAAASARAAASVRCSAPMK